MWYITIQYREEENSIGGIFESHVLPNVFRQVCAFSRLHMHAEFCLFNKFNTKIEKVQCD